MKYTYNKEQKKIISYPIGPLLVLAGAGSGKTSTIIGRIINLVNDRNIRPETILVLTFTNDAANHMQAKLEKEIGDDASKVQVCTFHGFSKNILMDKYLELGYSKPPKLMNSGDENYIIRKYFNDFGELNSIIFKREPIHAIGCFKKMFESFRNNLISDRELYEYKKEELKKLKTNIDSEEKEKTRQLIDVIEAFFKYQNWKKEENYIDYGDMIINLWNLLNENKKFIEYIQNKYQHVIVDEFQDNNYALSQIIKKIAEPENSILVVGDDDQCIYAFRQANIQNVKEFKDYYDCKKTISLKRNYRSISEILDLANDVISKNKNRMRNDELIGVGSGDKPLLFIGNDDGQIYQIIKCIKGLLMSGEKPDDIAILLRNHRKCEILNKELLDSGIRTNYFHEKLFDQSIVKDFIALINIWASSEKSYQSHIRILKKVTDDAEFQSILSSCNLINDSSSFVDFTHDEGVMNKSFIKILNNLKKIKTNNIREIVAKIISMSELYIKNPESYDMYMNNHILDHLMLIINDYCMNYGDIGGEDFIEYLNIQFEMNDEYISSLDAIINIPAINLMTIHGSKGMEFRYVFIPFMKSSVFPLRFNNDKTISSIPNEWQRWIISDGSDKELFLDEERRLFFVAITRAMVGLYLFAPEKYQSKFIKEIDNDLLIIKDIVLDQEEILSLEKDNCRYEIELENEIYLKKLNHIVHIKGENKKNKNLIKKELVKDKFYNEKLFKENNYMPLSASVINTYLTCALKFKYKYIYQLVDSKSGSLGQIGRLIHLIIEKFNKSLNKEKLLLFKFLEEDWGKCKFKYKQEEIQSKIDASQMLDNYWNFYQSFNIKHNITEYSFAFNVGIIKVVGRCDSIFIDDDDDIILIDYKTTKSNKSEKQLKKDFQLRIYSLFMFNKGIIIEGKLLKKIPNRILTVYLKDELIVKSVSFDEVEMKEIMDKINEIYGDMIKRKFPPNYSRHCEYCSYKDMICSEFN
jgi:DNA helicase-2/ATP-dependent DNA helicase PcrA